MDEQQIKTAARELAQESPVCVMGTVDEDGYPCLRPMYTMELADDFTAYFATARDTVKARHIEANPRLSLSWSSYTADMTAWRHAEIKGKGTVTDDKELRHRLWMDQLSGYFPGGADDPNFIIIVVKPQELLFTDDHSYPPYSVKF